MIIDENEMVLQIPGTLTVILGKKLFSTKDPLAESLS